MSRNTNDQMQFIGVSIVENFQNFIYFKTIFSFVLYEKTHVHDC